MPCEGSTKQPKALRIYVERKNAYFLAELFTQILHNAHYNVTILFYLKGTLLILTPIIWMHTCLSRYIYWPHQ